jgi:hypothetical protein
LGSLDICDREIRGFLGEPSARDRVARPNREVHVSIVVRYPASNMTKGQYETVRSALTDAGDWPTDGCQLHVCFGDENDMRVSEVWESREKFDAWGETLRPRIEEAGIQMSGEPEVFEAHIYETF